MIEDKTYPFELLACIILGLFGLIISVGLHAYAQTPSVDGTTVALAFDTSSHAGVLVWGLWVITSIVALVIKTIETPPAQKPNSKEILIRRL